MSRKKTRRMPPHIVLPNGMWRFVKKGAKKAISVKKSRVKTKRRVLNMARFRKKRASRRGMGMLGRGNLMSGVFKPQGILASALAGYAVADVINSPIAQPIQGVPFVDYAGAFVVGGVGGLAGAAARNFLAGKPILGTANNSGSNPYNY